MVKKVRELPSEVIAREIDEKLRTAIGRALNEWGRALRLPPLTWSIDHWDGHVTLVGTPSRRAIRKRSIVSRWVRRLDLHPVTERESHWHLAADGWHMEIRGWDD